LVVTSTSEGFCSFFLSWVSKTQPNHWTGKDQDDSSQDADHGYQFNNISFIDDISIFAETPEGMQTLLDVVQEFTTWCGM
jgi:hypothetical protein